MNPLGKKHTNLGDAVKTFPKTVFREWLRLRRRSADLYYPGWRTAEDKHRRIQLLDCAVVLAAGMN